MLVQSATTFRVITSDGPPTVSSRIFESKSSSLSVKGYNFAKCRHVLARLGKVHPSLSISILLLWWNWAIFCIASNVGTTSLLLYQRRKFLNDCTFSAPTHSPRRNSSLLQLVVFHRTSVWLAQTLLSSHYRLTSSSQDLLFQVDCILEVCCQRFRKQEALCYSIYLGGYTIRMEKLFTLLMSYKISGMCQDWYQFPKCLNCHDFEHYQIWTKQIDWLFWWQWAECLVRLRE